MKMTMNVQVQVEGVGQRRVEVDDQDVVVIAPDGSPERGETRAATIEAALRQLLRAGPFVRAPDERDTAIRLKLLRELVDELRAVDTIPDHEARMKKHEKIANRIFWRTSDRPIFFEIVEADQPVTRGEMFTTTVRANDDEIMRVPTPAEIAEGLRRAGEIVPADPCDPQSEAELRARFSKIAADHTPEEWAQLLGGSPEAWRAFLAPPPGLDAVPIAVEVVKTGEIVAPGMPPLEFGSVRLEPAEPILTRDVIAREAHNRLPVALAWLAARLEEDVFQTPFAGFTVEPRRRLAAVCHTLADHPTSDADPVRDISRQVLGALHAAELTYRDAPISLEHQEQLAADCERMLLDAIDAAKS